jgi:hypothetical protein
LPAYAVQSEWTLASKVQYGTYIPFISETAASFCRSEGRSHKLPSHDENFARAVLSSMRNGTTDSG